MSEPVQLALRDALAIQHGECWMGLCHSCRPCLNELPEHAHAVGLLLGSDRVPSEEHRRQVRQSTQVLHLSEVIDVVVRDVHALQ